MVKVLYEAPMVVDLAKGIWEVNGGQTILDMLEVRVGPCKLLWQGYLQDDLENTAVEYGRYAVDCNTGRFMVKTAKPGLITCDYRKADLDAEPVTAQVSGPEWEPSVLIAAELYCPHCGQQHIDGPGAQGGGWERADKRIHHTHECQHCRGRWSVYVKGT